MRVLAVDPGEKRLGIALSDPSGNFASPLSVLKHTSRAVDAAAVARLAEDHDARLIVIGTALDDDGEVTPQGRLAERLAAAIRQQTECPVVLWDESGTTQAARQTRIEMGVSRKKRRGHQDDLAAALILQSYLDAHPSVRTSL